MKVKVFGRLIEICESNYVEIDFVDSVELLKNSMETRFPLLKQHKYFIAIDKVISGSNDLIKPDSEIAFMPPYSGG
ncbi:MAG: hypothetical protein EYC69_11420 [Bacteroidetes bacterium]|nr:MAG: hypothetical protein EYC69_11420 [Bacteroidota bacterium]